MSTDLCIFSKAALEDLRREHSEVEGKYLEILFGYMGRTFKNPRAHEYAAHGFLRRIKTLVRCINKVFELLPPEQTAPPSFDTLNDAQIYIQAFVLNLFGCADNLAWIWVSEKRLTKPDGSPIPPTWIGLSPGNQFVRESFSLPFQQYLVGFDGWFRYLEDYRHALAHRIPLYIPPFTISPNDEAAYNDFEVRQGEALKRRDFAGHERLSTEQKRLGRFKPWILHSFHFKDENSNPIVFHPQLLVDFKTITELGQRMLAELDSNT